MKQRLFYIILARVRKKHPDWTKERAILTTIRLMEIKNKKKVTT